MKDALKLMTLALAMTVSSAALAQTTTQGSGMGQTGTIGGQQPAAQARPSGVPAGDFRRAGDSTRIEQFQLPPDVMAQLRAQRGPEQRPLELVQTYLLNQFGRLGFAELGDVEKVGESYAASVKTVGGEWTQVVIDPMAGTVAMRDPALGGQTAATGATTAPMTGATTAPSGRMGVGGGQTMAPGQAAGADRMTFANVEQFMNRYQCTDASLSSLADQVGGFPGAPVTEIQPLVQAAMEANRDGNNALCQLRLRQIGQILAGQTTAGTQIQQ